jgi:hypothetical protein
VARTGQINLVHDDGGLKIFAKNVFIFVGIFLKFAQYFEVYKLLSLESGSLNLCPPPAVCPQAAFIQG